MDSLTWTHLCVCVSKTERLAMLVFSFSFLLHLASGTTLLIVLLLPSFHACLVCFVLCWRTQISPLCLGNATTSSWEGRRGTFRCCPATDECQLIISWWLCSFLPSHSTASDVLPVCLLLFFFVEHRKCNSELKLSFEQSPSLHYTWVWKQEEFVPNPT